MASSDLRRGDVWLVAFGAARPGELGKNRPAVILTRQPFLEPEPDLLSVVAISSSRAPSDLRPAVGSESGIDRDSVVVCRAVRGISPSRLLRRLGAVPAHTLAAIERAVRFSLDLDS